jgi:hypothetical protein
MKHNLDRHRTQRCVTDFVHLANQQAAGMAYMPSLQSNPAFSTDHKQLEAQP